MSPKLVFLCLLFWIIQGISSASGGELIPPKADAIVGYICDRFPDHYTGHIKAALPQKSFRLFLQYGRVLKNADTHQLRQAGPITLPSNINPDLKRALELDNPAGNGTIFPLALRCSGCAATKDQLYFWELLNDWVLRIVDERGNECVLDISHKPMPLGLEQHRYTPEYQSFTPPRAKDINLLANAPLNWTWSYRVRVPVEKERVMAFIRSGKIEKYTSFVPETSRFTLPATVPADDIERLKKESINWHGRDPIDMRWILAEGAITTKDNDLLLWQIQTDNLMFLWDKNGRQVYLVR